MNTEVELFKSILVYYDCEKCNQNNIAQETLSSESRIFLVIGE